MKILKNKFKYSSQETDFINKSGFSNPYFWLATWGGLGLMRPAPGTWGTIGGLPLGMILFIAFGIKGLLIGAIWISWLGMVSADKLGQRTGIHDSPLIVIDEVAGLLITLCFAALDGHITVWDALICFFLFRFFDILKPYPINLLDQKLKGGLGVMADDIVAGLFAGITFIGIANAGIF